MKTTSATIGFVFGVVLLGALAGCTHSHQHAPVYSSPPPAYVETGVIVPHGYIYYPRYQVYYSGSRRQYIYRESRSWVASPAPPRVSVEMLYASPSVALDFHDAPEIHHARVVRQYPKYWKPPGWEENYRGRGYN